MTPAHFHSSHSVLPHSTCQLYPQAAVVTTPNKPWWEKKHPFESQRSKKEGTFSEFPRNTLLSFCWPKLCHMSISRPTTGRRQRSPLFQLDLSLEPKHMGSVREGLPPEQIWGSVRMGKSGNRSQLIIATSLQLCPSPWHQVAAGQGKVRLTLGPYRFKLTSAGMHTLLSALGSLLSFSTTTVRSWDATPAPPPPHPPAGPSSSAQSLWVGWFSGLPSPHHVQLPGKMLVF